MLRRAMLCAATIGVAACIDLSTDPDEIVAIEFNALPWPSVVAGDTLRDSTGAVAPLEARLFDGDGDEVTGAVEFLSQEQKVQVIDGGRVVAADTATGTVHLLASTSGIQSIVRQLEVVAAPDSVAADGTITPLTWVFSNSPTENLSVALGVRVLSTSADPPEGVRAWVLTFDLEAAGNRIAPTDTTQLFLINDAGLPSYADTTDIQGRVSRRLRLRIVAGRVAPDSAVITVRASYKGAPVTGSPVRLVLPIQPR